MADSARFCTHCGKQLAGGAASSYAPPVSMEPLDYTIQGDNLQLIRIRLKPGQEVYAEAGKMVYKQTAIEWDTRMSGNTLGEKIWGALKRKVMGESLFLTYFRANAQGEVGFAGDYPGRIQAFALGAGQSILVQRDSFLCAQSSVTLNIAFTQRLGAGFFGGEGFILERLTGPGTAFIHAGGDHIEFQLAPGETLQVDTGCVVAYTPQASFEIQYVGKIKTALFGGEGLFLARLSGPGQVWLQSLPFSRLASRIFAAAPQRGGSREEGSVLGGFGAGGLLGSVLGGGSGAGNSQLDAGAILGNIFGGQQQQAVGQAEREIVDHRPSSHPSPGANSSAFSTSSRASFRRVLRSAKA